MIHKTIAVWLPLFLLVCNGTPLLHADEQSPNFRKQAGVLYPRALSENAIANAEKFEWAKELRDRIVERAKPWRDTPNDQLWEMMFGATIPRSWMVWSDGYCPQCKKDVKMYSWIMDPWTHPFKTQCPHCETFFPTNDFEAFYRSGLDEYGVFDPNLADRALLFNTDHPNPDDPLHTFGVDDGTGYVEGEKKWRFIGAYLVYGQWKKLVLDGAVKLSEAYFVTGDPVYARKTAILLDRIADVYPTFDFIKQAVVYERDLGCNGYVSTWHDACEEVRELAQAYDRIFNALPKDKELVRFLSRKAKEYKLENPKTNFNLIQDNIENRIFRDTIQNEYKIRSNYPRTPLAILTLETVIGWPANPDKVLGMISEIIETSAKVDGVTGEKGMTGYSRIGPGAVGDLIGRFDRLDPALFDELIRKFPQLRETFRFHIDTWIAESYYPRVGDCGSFGQQYTSFAGLSFAKPAAGVEPSMFQLLWRLYERTQDPAFVQSLYISNGRTVEGLPHDLCAPDPEAFQKKVQTVIDRVGTEIDLPDINKEQWRLAILRSGKSNSRRAAWLDYDSGGRHSHRDGLNIGLFAKGLDLLPDFGYPPVGYGGWDFPKAVWYTKTAAHNTVVVDGKDQARCDGATTLWGSGKRIHLIRATAPCMTGGERYERTLALVDLSEEDSYLFDLFYVEGGSEHAKFITPLFGTPHTQGLNLQPAPDFGRDTLMRNTQLDSTPQQGWFVDWAIEDFYEYLPEGTDIHLRVTDLTPNIEAALSECWIDVGQNFGGAEHWVSRLMTRRKTDAAPLSTCFVSILEPYEKTRRIEKIKRLPLQNKDGVPLDEKSGLIVLDLANGRKHTIAFVDPEDKNSVSQPEFNFSCTGEFCILSSQENKVSYLAIANGNYLHYQNVEIRLKEQTAFFEAAIKEDTLHALSGNPSNIDCILINGKKQKIQ